jgi:hypothetical protein
MLDVELEVQFFDALHQVSRGELKVTRAGRSMRNLVEPDFRGTLK